MKLAKRQIVIVTGTRHDSKALRRAISRRLKLYIADVGRLAMVFQGECPSGGADKIAKVWCELKHVACVGFSPSSPDDRSGLKIRNKMMVTAAKALGDVLDMEVILEAFPDEESSGTWDTVNKAKALGVRIEVTKVS
jgi:hypothetical protein